MIREDTPKVSATHKVQFTYELVLTDEASNNEDTGRESMFPRVPLSRPRASCKWLPAYGGRLVGGQSPRFRKAVSSSSHTATADWTGSWRLRALWHPHLLDQSQVVTCAVPAQEPAASNMAVATSGFFRASTGLVNPHFSFTAMDASQQILHGQAVERIQEQIGETNKVMRLPLIQQQGEEAVQMTSLERNSQRIAAQTGDSLVPQTTVGALQIEHGKL